MKTARMERKCTHCKGSMACEDERDHRCRDCRIKCGSEIMQQTADILKDKITPTICNVAK